MDRRGYRPTIWSMNTIELVIGNKNYSSWSLRPWVLLKHKDIQFEETRIPLYQEGSHEELLKHSDYAKVPVLKFDHTTVWDSLAICETIAELFPEKQCWPEEPAQRALARAISSEMHSGFFEVRNTLPMNCRKSMTYSPVSAELQAEITRIQAIWTKCRKRFRTNGSYLFGSFTIADAMYAPVVLRFNSYGINCGEFAQEYMANMLGLPELRDWITAGQAEVEHMAQFEVSAALAGGHP